MTHITVIVFLNKGAICLQGEGGWNLRFALKDLQETGADEASKRAAQAVLERLKEVHNFLMVFFTSFCRTPLPSLGFGVSKRPSSLTLLDVLLFAWVSWNVNNLESYVSQTALSSLFSSCKSLAHSAPSTSFVIRKATWNTSVQVLLSVVICERLCWKRHVIQVGESYFRVHPKGVGIICKRDEGIPPLTFVEEYLGAVYTPARWHEMQVNTSPLHHRGSFTETSCFKEIIIFILFPCCCFVCFGKKPKGMSTRLQYLLSADELFLLWIWPAWGWSWPALGTVYSFWR